MAIVFTDDTKTDIHLEGHPQRIISLCPSITETLIKLGLKDQLAGRTDYCYRPQGEADELEKIGGPKTIDMACVDKIKPELLIAAKEESTREQIEKLREKYPVFVFDVSTYAEALDMIIRLGEITGTQEKAIEMSDHIDKAFAGIPRLNQSLTFLYLVWKEPLMAAGKRTYINDILTSHGFVNCLHNFIQRYVTLNFEVFKMLQFDMAFLPSEPYKFDEDDKKDILAFFPQADVRIVDGEMFSWYGYRMIHAAEYLTEMIRKLNER